MSNRWPLVGRAGELHLVEESLTGGGRGAMLAGPTGSGKTRLAQEFVERAQSRGLVTAQVSGTHALAGLPLGAFTALLPAVDDARGPNADNLASLLRRSAAALAGRAGERRLILFVDDAHLLDDVSAALVKMLAVSGSAFVVLTVRTDEPVPEPVLALWKDGVIDRVDVPGLSAEAVGELLAIAVDGPVDQGTVARLAVRSLGNSMFLRELVLGAQADGSLCRIGGVWRLIGPLAPSPRLVELVEAKLSGLPTDERQTMEIVALGEPLGPAELAALAPAAAVESLERKDLLSSTTEGQRLFIRLAHPIFGDVLRARTPALRARNIAQALADALESTGVRRQEDVLRVAGWRLEGGGARPETLLAAATTARWRYDFVFAERLARAAVAQGAGFEAALLAAQLAGLQGRSGDAERELASLAEDATDDAQRAVIAVNRVDNLAFYMGRIDEALHLAEAAEAAADATGRDEIAARRVGILLASQGPAACALAAEPILDRAEGRALAWASTVGAFSLARIGRSEAALQAARRGHAAHLDLARPLDWDPSIQLIACFDALAHSGRFDEAERLAADQYERSLASGNTDAQAFFAWALGKAVAERGHVHAAIRYEREGAALFRQLERPQQVEFCLTYLALAFALGGRPAEAAGALAELEGLGLAPTLYLRTDVLQARAWAAVAAGGVRAGHDFLVEAAAVGRRIGDRVGEASSLHGLARLGEARQVTERLAELSAEMEGVLVSTRAAHARALASGEPTEHEAASEAFSAMGAHLLAAEAAADAAVAWRRAGSAREATGAARRAATLARSCEGAVTPILGRLEPRASLTRSEHEIARLAAAGHSNREIAQRLVLSERTVGNHLHHIYTKLGVKGRQDLPSAM